ncbi:unnamed protein product, partial [Lymnaea stagnalis]
MTTLLLVGRAGNGKSSVSNSILGTISAKQLVEVGYEVQNLKKLGAEIGAKLGARLGEQLVEINDFCPDGTRERTLLHDFVEQFQKELRMHNKRFVVKDTSAKAILQNIIRRNKQFAVVDCSGIGDTGFDMAGDIKE